MMAKKKKTFPAGKKYATISGYRRKLYKTRKQAEYGKDRAGGYQQIRNTVRQGVRRWYLVGKKTMRKKKRRR